MTPNLTPLSAMGEFQLIDHLTKNFSFQHLETVKAIGDDAAIVLPKGQEANAISTDLLLEGVHFDLSYVPLGHLGYKAVAVNISDIVAMNAVPYGITVSVGMSSRFSVEAAEELFKGIQFACEQYGVELLGGDTSSSQQGLVISVTAFGHQAEDKMVYRNGAKPKDLICVTGDLGGAYAGFLVLDREKQVFLKDPKMQPDLSPYDYVVGRQLRPDIRTGMLKVFADLGIQPNAMMDISDGLASELHHIGKQSGVGAFIYAHKIPIDPVTVSVAEEFEISPTTFAMNGGEDYELLFTVPLSDYKKISEIEGVSIIGHITEDKAIQISLSSGQVIDVEAQGWKHFSS